ncbi:MAG: hypothetical protein IH987_04195 [Planctomycetes bacterium]|nr:hypothetical protein [Planctomycetota bacterium]
MLLHRLRFSPHAAKARIVGEAERPETANYDAGTSIGTGKTDFKKNTAMFPKNRYNTQIVDVSDDSGLELTSQRERAPPANMRMNKNKLILQTASYSRTEAGKIARGRKVCGDQVKTKDPIGHAGPTRYDSKEASLIWF